ncbi:MAG: DUF447 family protein [Candidatus Symbiobacter sp.]|nr:DUF447 family protein [Candidatus Symbiobacter sp.]
MINETIITSITPDAKTHFAPMGLHWDGSGELTVGTNIMLAPFRPSTSLDNFIRDSVAVVNFSDDVGIIADCILGKQDFPTLAAAKIRGRRLENCLAHAEIEFFRIEEDATRPQCHGKIIHLVTHKNFAGFNRAQHAVIEAAILYSRRHLLPRTEIAANFERLAILVAKTASEREHTAWQKLVDAWDTWQKN